MNDQRLQIYVNDHLALLVAEIELAERCRKNNPEGQIGFFLQQLAADLKQEQQDVRAILERLGGSVSHVKQGIGWLAEKAGRFKLNDTLLQYSDLSRLVELETLQIAARERLSFWENIEAARAMDTRISQVDVTARAHRARGHSDQLRQHRLAAARRAL